jgi:hypothetical protein
MGASLICVFYLSFLRIGGGWRFCFVRNREEARRGEVSRWVGGGGRRGARAAVPFL